MAAQSTTTPFDHRLSARLDDLILQLDDCRPTMRRAWLRSLKFWYEINVPAFYAGRAGR